MKKIRNISEFIVLLGILFSIGVVGGLDRGKLTIGAGLGLIGLTGLVCWIAAAAARKAENRDA